MNPDCREIARLLRARADGELDAAETARADAHLSGCEDCRRKARLIDAVRASVARAAAPAAPPGFSDAVARRARGAAPSRRLAWAAAAPAFALAAALAVLLVRRAPAPAARAAYPGYAGDIRPDAPAYACQAAPCTETELFPALRRPINER